MIVGSWVYPLVTVYLPHHDYGDTPLTQTHTLRGRVIPAIYHFDDLEDLLVAAAQYTGETRLARYREELSDVTSATELLERLERLHTEDVADGYMAAVQELTAASSSSPKLAAGIQAQIEPWQNFAEHIAARFVSRTPFAALIPIPELARAAIALFLGMEMLSHLDTDGTRSDAFFTSAKQAAALFDLLP